MRCTGAVRMALRPGQLQGEPHVAGLGAAQHLVGGACRGTVAAEPVGLAEHGARGLDVRVGGVRGGGGDWTKGEGERREEKGARGWHGGRQKI